MTDTGLIAILVGAMVFAAILGVIASVRPFASIVRERSDDEAWQRRRDARRFNEHIKLLATFANGVGVATFVTLAIAPLFAGNATFASRRTLLALLAAVMIHMSGQLILRLWKSED